MRILEAAAFSAILALLPFAAAAAAPPPATLSAADQANVARVEAYLDSIRTVHGHFLQTTDGDVVGEGNFYLERPGKMRIQYDTPNKFFMVASGSTLSIWDPRLKKASYVPVDATPAYFLMQEKIGLGNAVIASKLERGDASLRVTVYEKDKADEGRIVLIFSDRPLELKKWKMIDHDGNETDIALVNAEFNTKLDPNLFKFVDPSPGGGNERSSN